MKKKTYKNKKNTQIALYHKIKCKIQDKVEFDHIVHLVCALVHSLSLLTARNMIQKTEQSGNNNKRANKWKRREN